MGSRRLLPWLAMTMVLVGLSNGDFDKDKEECADTLVGLATCLPYVSGQSKAPTMDCCAKLKPVLDKNKVCLCKMVKDRNEPGLGVKINGTLALSLPDSCHLPSNITDCPKLMNWPPNSPEAKIFEDYGESINKSNITTVAPSDFHHHPHPFIYMKCTWPTTPPTFKAMTATIFNQRLLPTHRLPSQQPPHSRQPSPALTLTLTSTPPHPHLL